MKIGVCTKVNHIELQDRPVPKIDKAKVLVKVSVCGICGSDLAAWRGSGHKKYPYTPGHEFCGVIEQMGKGVSGLAIGQRVVINPNFGCQQCRFCQMGKENLCDFLKSRPIKSNGGFAEYVAIDYRMVYPLSENLGDELAAFIEPLSCALHAVNSALIEPGENVVVFGAGLMGYLAGIALRRSGAKIVFVEPAEKRRQRISSALCLLAITPKELLESELTGRVDKAIDFSGSGHAVAAAIKVLRKAGRLVLGGLVMNIEAANISFIDVTTKELELVGVWLNPKTFAESIDLAIDSKDLLIKLETESFRLEQIAAAFQRAENSDAPKILVRP